MSVDLLSAGGWLLLGILLLGAGGEAAVVGASRLARGLGISPGLIGMTLIALGTSLPELVVTLQAVLAGRTDLAVGNVVGSNIANILLVLAVCVVVVPLTPDPRQSRTSGLLLAAATLMLAVGLATFAVIPRLIGAVAILAGAGAGILLARTSTPEAESSSTGSARLLSFAVCVSGLVLLPVGGERLIHGALGLARIWEIPDAIVGLTLIAVGTSLPELATSLSGIRRGETDLVLGNVIGSCIANILLILGPAALIRPLPVPAGIVSRDLPVLVSASAVVCLLVLRRRTVGRSAGIAALIAYVCYIGVLYGSSQ